MKKKFLLLFLVLALALTAAGTAVSACAQTASAEGTQNEQNCGTPAEVQEGQEPARPAPMPREGEAHAARRTAVSVNGCGKVTVDADAAQISFRIRALSDSFKEGQKRISEMKTALFEAVRGVCEASGDSAPYGDSYRPVSDGNVGGYEFISVVYVKIRDTAKAEEAKNAAIGTGAAYMYTCYQLENESAALSEALTLAKADAAEKAKTLLDGEVQLIQLKEECSWHCASDEAGKITVHANVRAKYASAQA